MNQKKRKSSVYLQKLASIMSVTKIMFILIISSATAADNKCQLTSMDIEKCDQPSLRHKVNDYDSKISLNSIDPFRLQELEQRDFVVNLEYVLSKIIVESDLRNDITYFEQLMDYSSSEANGRSLNSSKGFKKLMWPVLIGAQVVKTVLLAMFLPSILGSLGKMVGKGLSTVSGFTHQTEPVDDLDFKDNSYNSDKDQFHDYTHPQTDTSANYNQNYDVASQMYDAATANNNAISRFGITHQQQYFKPEPSLAIANKRGETIDNKKDDFKVFHDIPLSSMLLTNYDPFYSPVLSRLDAIFQQLGLPMGNEDCREKLVCLMYKSPAKFAPYSNLVSAQLSRELNHLRKPTSDNPHILRFFKYMRAAKLGQDKTDCDQNFKLCVDLNESNPAMVTTYNDINKLVQARTL